MLVNGEKFSDKHINLTQRILKLKFPKINGLRLTLLQNKPHKDPTDSAILQILHTGGDHWICATTIGTASGKKCWYTTQLMPGVDDTTICLLKVQFLCSASNIFIVEGMQKQRGGKECGLYAIINATGVAFGKDPVKMT